MALRFGDFEVEGLLGPGGVTETYRARRPGGQPVALKLLRTDRSGKDPRIAAAFVNLGLRNGEIKVPGVARVLEVSNEPGAVFVVSELVEGANLETLWDNAVATGGIEHGLVAAVGAQIARTLSSLHERKDHVVHGGLCPGNVIVTPEGKVVLTDVGFSSTLRGLTDFPIDKFWYVAPELLSGSGKPTPAADLYSLGAVLYYLLTGEPPVMGDTRQELIEQLEEPPPPIPNIPDWLELAINNLLSRNPDDRPRTAAAAALSLVPPPALATRLGQIVSGNTPPPVRVDVPTSNAPARQPAPAQSAKVPPSAPASPVSTELPELDALPSLDLLDEGAAPKAGADDAFIGTANDGSTAMFTNPLVAGRKAQSEVGLARGPNNPGAAATALARAAETIDLAPSPANVPPAVPPLAPLAPQSGPVAAVSGGRNEPEWVDDPGPGLGAGSTPAVDDDFFDLPSAAGRQPVLGAGPQTMDLVLPDLPNVSAAAPRVLDLHPPVSDREHDGIHGDEDRLGTPIDPNQVGVVEYGEEGGNERIFTSAPVGTQPVNIVLPRRAGSARVGGPRKKSKSSIPALMAVAVLGAMGAGYAFVKMQPKVVAPPPPVKAPEVDPAEEKARAAREQQQQQAAEPVRGQLTIETTPKGATVWIDGQERGKTPIVIETTPGPHRLVITKPGFKMLRQITDTSEGLIMKRTLPPANINFGGTVALRVECKTEGKYPVFVDGRDTGLLCPVDSLMIPEGNRLIGLYVIPENKVWSFEREVLKGSTTHRVIFNY